MGYETWEAGGSDDGDVGVLDVVSHEQRARKFANGRAPTPVPEVSLPVTKSKMIRIPRGVVITVGLTYLGWMGWAIWQTKDSVAELREGQAEMRAQVGYNAGRVDRIVNEVPTLRQQIAREKAKAPARQVVVTTVPRRLTENTSVAAISVIDLGLRKTTAHYVTLTNEQARVFDASVAGAVVRSAPNAMSFSAIALLGSDSGAARRVPRYTDATSSFMVWSTTDSVPISAIAVMFVVDSVRTYNASVRLGNWSSVVDEVRLHPRIYAVGRDSGTPHLRP